MKTATAPAPPAARQRPHLNPSEAVMFTVEEFCQAHRISVSAFYELRRAGEGPVVIKIGRKPLISKEDAEDWRRKMRERAAAPDNR